MTAATLAAPSVVARAARDSDYYAEMLPRLRPADRAEFIAAVDHAYRATNPARPLTYAEKCILQFADRRFPTPGHREQAIRDEFGYSATRYYQVLNALLDRPEAAQAYPVTVGRLRRQRETRRVQRSNRTNGATR